MYHRMHIFAGLVVAMGLLVPLGLAQKPPAPSPAPKPSQPSAAPGAPAPGNVPNVPPGQPGQDLVMFLMGRVAANDGTVLPNDVMIERVCNEKVRQQVYAAPNGSFSMQLGSRTDSFLDASGDGHMPYEETGKNTDVGIPRHDLTNCELRARAAGFRSSAVNLVDLTTFGSSADVGAIVLQRTTKIKGTTISATPFRAPKDARRAYEKGLGAEKDGKLVDARRYFEQAVQIYPKYASAWFQLGNALGKENQKAAARAAYLQATTHDPRFLPPYLALTLMAVDEGNWTEVRNLSGHILDLDPLNRTEERSSILDLDSSGSAEAYYYNALANYKLNKPQEAEKSALKAEQYVELSTRSPQLHLLLAELLVQNNNYGRAISELQTYLELDPHAKDADQIREQLAELEKLNEVVPPSKIGKPE